MPHQNRVTPTGELIAVADRGTLTGNRGVLHDPAGRIVRQHQVRRWITCRLEFRDRHRAVMMPGRYTHLFFLDEATAFAAGHRPCAECRREDYQQFRRCWAGAGDLADLPGADAMDDALHLERGTLHGRRRTVPVPFADLPDGAFVLHPDGAARLVSAGSLLRWTPAGYTGREPVPSGPLPVLTPPSVLAAFRAGYRPTLHPSAMIGSSAPQVPVRPAPAAQELGS